MQAGSYHPIDLNYPGMEVLNEEPPVYLVHNFLSRQACSALIRAANQGRLPLVEYDNRAVINKRATRWLALPGVLLCVVPFLFHPEADLAATATTVASSAALFGAFTAVLWRLLPAMVLQAKMGGKIFTGTKWSTEAHTLRPEAFRQSHGSGPWRTSPQGGDRQAGGDTDCNDSDRARVASSGGS